MKIIDLLNKMVNGEEVPKEIKIKTSEGTIAPFYLSDDKYINNYTEYSLLECLDEFQLTDKILYEDEFEDIEKIIYPDLNEDYEFELHHKHIEEIYDTINWLIKNQKKIIERLNEKGNI